MKKIVLISALFALLSGCFTNYEGVKLNDADFTGYERIIGKYNFIEKKEDKDEIVNLEIKKLKDKTYQVLPLDPEDQKDEEIVILSFLKIDQQMLAVFRTMENDKYSEDGIILLFQDKGEKIVFTMFNDDKVLEYNKKYPGRLSGEDVVPKFGPKKFVFKGTSRQLIKSLEYLCRETDIFQKDTSVVFNRVK